MAAGDVTVTTIVSGSTTNGNSIKGFAASKTYANIADVIEREITVPITAVTTLVTLNATLGGSALSTINFFKIKNMDSTNFIQLGFIDTGVKAFYVKLLPGETFTFNGLAVLDANATGGVIGTLTSVDSIVATANTAACKCSYVAF